MMCIYSDTIFTPALAYFKIQLASNYTWPQSSKGKALQNLNIGLFSGHRVASNP